MRRDPYEVILSVRQWAEVETLARARNAAKAAGTSKRFDDTQSDLDLHIIGMMAERAFCIACDLTTEAQTDASLHGDDGIDVRLKNGKGIEIKYRGERGRDFAINTASIDDFKAEIGVLMWPGQRARSFEIVGWITRDRFAEIAEVVHLRGDRLLVPWQRLSSPHRLINRIRQVQRVSTPTPAPLLL